MTPKGLYQKYIITKADGGEVDPDAFYFVLRPDTDPAAVKALETYAFETKNLDLATEIFEWLEKTQA